SEKLAEGQGAEYKDYFQFTEPLRHVPPHRVLAINRGEKENALTVKIEWDADLGLRVALDRLPVPPQGDGSREAPSAERQEGSGPPAPTDPADTAAPPESSESRGERQGPPRHGPRPPRGPRPDPLKDHPHADLIRQIAADALGRLLVPSLEREIRRELTGRAEGHAVDVFARNLRSLVMARPLIGRRVLAIDPGFR